ncbi:DnaD domain-containing protein [Terribacillus sp. AE2B 122]|uniref:DnaD domain-containing protein n=1 Tax=Terribacillus sp. AE2B 122 TaxID=1331902 RepID=UPI001440B290|nr:DnaD domain protein [Terribacillus sp. AE2B 122]VVM35096.1 DnaA analog2C DnaD domain protein [Terribacillus sp. AE2B 122]
MAKFRMVHTEFWSDPKVIEEMTPEDKLFFLYLLTNSRTTQIGIYQITKKVMAFEIGFSTESANALMDRFINHHKLIKYNYETRELAIKNWGKYNFNKGGKPIEDCVKSELSDVKDLSLIKYVAAGIANEKIRTIYDTYYESLTARIPISGTSVEEKQESSNNAGLNDTSTIRTTIRGQEKEEEKEEEKDKEVEEEKDAPHGDSDTPPTPSESITFFQKNIGLTSAYVSEEILQWIDDVGDDLVLFALKRAVDQNKPTWAYAKAILKKWLQNNIRTVQQAQDEQERFSNQNQRKQNNSVSNKPAEIVPEWFQNKTVFIDPPPTTPEEAMDAAEMLRQFNEQKAKDKQ